MQKRTLYQTIFCAIGITLAAPDPIAAAVFGTDDRRAVPSEKANLADSIGTLVSTGSGALCTAFCVAPNVIATASHCIYGTSAAPRPDIAMLSFRLPANSSTASFIAGRASSSQSQHVIAGTTSLSVTPPIGANRDWAIVRLEKPVCAAGGLALSTRSRDEVLAAADRGEIYQIAAHRDLKDDSLKFGGPCPLHTAFPDAGPDVLARDFANAGAILLHTCDTGGGSSGSPLLIDGINGPEVVGINVGTYVFSRSIVAAGSADAPPPSQAIANTAVATPEFSGAVEEQMARSAGGYQISVRRGRNFRVRGG